METINDNTNATQLLEVTNTAFGSATGIQEILASDNAADFIEKLNHNFEVMGTGGDAVFPANTILQSAIGSLEAGEDIGGMTIDDFIAYGIQSKPRKITFLHTSDSHANYGNGWTTTLDTMDTEMQNDDSIDFAIHTGDFQTSANSALAQKIISMNEDGKMLSLPGNHDAYEGSANNNAADLQTFIKALMTDGDGNLAANFGSTESYGCYWYKDFPLGRGKLRLIAIDEYNFTSSGTAHKVYISQAQVDWLIDLLVGREAVGGVGGIEGLGGDDYFMLAQHTPPMPYTKDSSDDYNIMKYRRANKFCSARLYTWGSLNNDPKADFIPSLIDGYLKKEHVQKTNRGNITVSVDADFSNATPAKFLGWITGHIHSDFHHAHPKYTNQIVMTVDCGCLGIDKNSDLRPNENSTGRPSGIYLYNRVTIDVIKKTIHIERKGYKTTCAHTVDPESWNGGTDYPETLDPHYVEGAEPYTYGSITRDEITFDFNANEIENTNTNTNTEEEQENEN